MIRNYESHGNFTELVSLLESGLNLERAHVGMFTELAIIYSKYQPEKMMEHLKLYASRINMPKAIRAAEKMHMWSELVYLYAQYGEYDHAVSTMIEYSPDCWEQPSFREYISKVSNAELCYEVTVAYHR